MNIRSTLATLLLTLCTVLLMGCAVQPEPNITAEGSPDQGKTISESEAWNYIGERATVCGKVVDAEYATGSNGMPTFLNFKKPSPHHPFSVVIWGSDRQNFPSNPEIYYLQKSVCASGLIETYKGKPQIIANGTNQIAVSN